MPNGVISLQGSSPSTSPSLVPCRERENIQVCAIRPACVTLVSRHLLACWDFQHPGEHHVTCGLGGKKEYVSKGHAIHGGASFNLFVRMLGFFFFSFILGHLHPTGLASPAANNFCQLLTADTRHRKGSKPKVQIPNIPELWRSSNQSTHL